MIRRRVTGSALAAALTLVAGAVGATAYHAVSAAFGLIMAGVVLVEGLLIGAVGGYLTRQAHARAARADRAQKAARPPLPYEWSVPDYPPSDLST